MASPIEESIQSKKRSLALGVIERRVKFLKENFFSPEFTYVIKSKNNINRMKSVNTTFVELTLENEPNSHIGFSEKEKDKIIKILNSIVDLVDKL